MSGNNEICSYVNCKRECKDNCLPIRKSKGAAGYDLSSVEDVTILARKRKLVDTGFRVCIPPGYYAEIKARSGMSLKYIDIGAGVIDSDYRSNIFVLLINHDDKDYEVKKGDRIAQLIFIKCENPNLVEVEELDETLRGGGGFGSTGR